MHLKDPREPPKPRFRTAQRAPVERERTVVIEHEVLEAQLPESRNGELHSAHHEHRPAGVLGHLLRHRPEQ